MNVSWVKSSVRYNTDIITHDSHVNLHNRIFLCDDENENDVKATCDPRKKLGISHSPLIDPTHVLMRALLFLMWSWLLKRLSNFAKQHMFRYCPYSCILLMTVDSMRISCELYHLVSSSHALSRAIPDRWCCSLRLTKLGSLPSSRDLLGPKTILIPTLAGLQFCIGSIWHRVTNSESLQYYSTNYCQARINKRNIIERITVYFNLYYSGRWKL